MPAKSVFCYSTVVINGILTAYFWWSLSLLSKFEVPQRFATDSSAALLHQRYANANAKLEVWMSASNFLLIVLVNVIMVATYIVLKRKKEDGATSGLEAVAI